MYARRKFAPRPDSVARGLSAQRRASWQELTGSLSAEPRPTRLSETLKLSFFSFFHIFISAAVSEAVNPQTVIFFIFSYFHLCCCF